MAAWHAIDRGPVLGPVHAYTAGVLDPYLLWADSTGFADYPSATQLRVLIELAEGFDAAQLQAASAGCAVIAPAYANALAAICAATVTPAFFGLLTGPLKDKLRRIDLAEPIIPDRPAPWAARPLAPGRPGRKRCDDELMLGVIDYGCPFAHQRFRARQGAAGAWSTRLLYFWDQDSASLLNDGEGAEQSPPEFGYGRELSRAQLNALIRRHTDGACVDEDACYSDCGNTVMRRPVSHGAHVLDVFAGPSPVESLLLPQEGGAIDQNADHSAASGADIVFVQLPARCLQDTSGGWLGAQVLDGVRYILECAGPQTRRVVVNISYGSYVGPHDGSSLIERGLDALVAEARAKGVRLSIVLPAGNSRLTRCHAREVLQPRGHALLRWHVLPDTGTPSFLQLWLSRAEGVCVTVTSPDGASTTLNQGEMTASASNGVSHGLAVYSSRHGVEDAGGMVLVALRRTASVDPSYPTAPPGVWAITVSNNAGQGPAVEVSAYVSRNDVDVGMLRRGRQSFLFDPRYDPERYLRAAEDDRQAFGVQRSGTLNGIATGAKVVVVGGWRYRDDQSATTASVGPTRTNRTKVATGGLDWEGVSEESRALPGVLASANRSGTTVRLRGTSFAAPQAARKLAKRAPD